MKQVEIKRRDGSTQAFVRKEAERLYRLRDDNTNPYTNGPRQNDALVCPPMVFPGWSTTRIGSGTTRTNMSKYGWEEYLRQLNGEKFEAAVSRKLAMFNGAGWPQMESLLFGCNLFRAVETDKAAWARILTLDYTAGPPQDMPDYATDPVAVQKFTMICRMGGILSRNPPLYYPVVSNYPIYIPWSWLEVAGPEMETQAPPGG